MYKILLALGVIVVLSACSTSETYKRNFEQVTDALNERFDRNQWSNNSAETSTIREPVLGTVRTYDYFHKQNPNTNVRIRIEAKRIDSETTEVAVEIDDYPTPLWPFFHERSYQRNFHDVFFSRLKNKKWENLAYEPANYLERGDARKSNVVAPAPMTQPAGFPDPAPASAPVEPAFEDIPAVDFDI